MAERLEEAPREQAIARMQLVARGAAEAAEHARELPLPALVEVLEGLGERGLFFARRGEERIDEVEGRGQHDLQ